MEVLKDFILRFARVYMVFDSRFEDKEITGTEAVEIAMSGLMELPGAFQNLKAAANEAETISDVDKGKLIADVREAFDIQNDKAEKIAVAGMDFVISGYRLQRAVVS